MEQRSVLTQTTQPQAKHQRWPSYRWMRYFFTEDVSADNRHVVELQRRATWIGLALVLQAINEIDHRLYFPFIQPFGSLIPLIVILGSFYAIWMAFRPARTQGLYTQKHPTRLQRILLICTLLVTVAGGIELGRGIWMCFLPPQFSNDGTSLDTNAAILLIEGRNPYTDSNMIDLARRFPIQPDWTTPLRIGQFKNRLDYPSMSDLQSVLDTDLRAKNMPEFESKVSYPALSFLTLVPFVLLKDYNVLPFYMLSYLLLVAIGWKLARRELRPWVLLLALANIPMWTSTIGGNLDLFSTLLVVMAWFLRNRRWSSAVFFGLALATKQTAWFFVPFYAILLFRQYGFKETVYRMTIASSLFLVFNLPFIVWNAQGWLAGISAPLDKNMFPMGVGIIDLSITHLLPYLPQLVYSVLEAIAMLGSLIWYWRICRKYPEAAMLLAVLPLFLAWRSLPSYFYCAAFPLYILMAAKTIPASRTSVIAATDDTQEHVQPVVAITPVGVYAAMQLPGVS
ncbi:MAG: hypothetical protein NVS4B12_10810 [Ktedonobacteraceae bacterium]